jgi:RTX calcium-binding nonapeptide repeat (4 copies)
MSSRRSVVAEESVAASHRIVRVDVLLLLEQQRSRDVTRGEAPPRVRVRGEGMRALIATVFAFALGPVQPAGAASVDTSGGCDRYDNCDYVIHVRAAPGEANHLIVSSANGSAVLSDQGVALTAGRRCTSVDEHTVTCLGDVARVNLDVGDGDDTVDASRYNASPATIEGGPGNDRLIGSASSDWLHGGPGRDRISGGGGPDTISFRGSRGPVIVDLRTQEARVLGHLERFDGIENAGGGISDDVLIGDSGDNQLSGGSGDDRLRGGQGDDRLAGGPGTDTLRGGPGDDMLGTSGYPRPPDRGAEDVGCGSGTDAVEPADAPFIVHGDCEQLGAERFPLSLGIDRGATTLLVDTDGLAKGARLVAMVRLAGRVEREARLVKTTARFAPGFWRLALTSPRIDAARARGAVVVRVTVRVRAPRA